MCPIGDNAAPNGYVVRMVPPIPGPGEGLNAAVAAELRAQQGREKMTTARLADLSGVPYGTLRRYLSADRYIDLTVLDALAYALGTTSLELVAAASSPRGRRRSTGVLDTERLRRGIDRELGLAEDDSREEDDETGEEDAG
jgi:transcriptional regulator with XRE-family HTH domain